MRSRSLQVSAALLLLFLAVSPDLQGDTEQLVDQARVAQACLRNGGPYPCPAGQFPPLQFLVASLLSLLPLSNIAIQQVLARISLLAFVGTLFLIFRLLRPRSERSAWIAIGVLSMGVLTHYARSSFGEMLSAFVLLCPLAGVLGGWSAVALAVSVFAAGISKDTAVVMLLPLYAGASLVSGRRMSDLAKPYVIGAIASITTLIAFNLFRWGSLKNLGYLSPDYFVPGIKLQLSHLAAIWLSPSGGLLFFWPSFTFLLIWALGKRPIRIPVLSALVALIGLTLLFSRWFDPLGWWAWGPRLIIPWIPACVLLILWYESPRLSGWTAALIGLMSLPQLLVFFHSDAWRISFSAAPDLDPSAPFFGRESVPPNMMGHYSSQQSALWKSPLPLILKLFSLPSAIHPILVAIIIGFAGVFFYQVFRRASSDYSRPTRLG